MKLLTPAHANAKTAKNQQFDQYLTYIMHLAPYTLSGYNVCPKASQGCAAACLNTAGRGAFSSVQNARIAKTQRFVKDRSSFIQDLIKDIDAAQRKAYREGKKLVIRLNGTSDISWEMIKLPTGLNVFQTYPDVIFYDYTKVLNRLPRIASFVNYHVVFSRSESNWDECVKALKMGVNVAVVFDSADLPLEYEGYQVVDGDSHDLRFLEYMDGKKGVIIGLKAKGKARRDESGFVVKTEDSIKVAA